MRLSYPECHVQITGDLTASLFRGIRYGTPDYGDSDRTYRCPALPNEIQHLSVGPQAEPALRDLQIFLFIGGIQAYGHRIYHLRKFGNYIPAIDQITQSVGVETYVLPQFGMYAPSYIQQDVQSLGGFTVSAEDYLA